MGISCDGHLILNVEDVRQNWLHMIRGAHKFDDFLKEIPEAESRLSSVLSGIHITNRKFRPNVMVQSYIQHLRKLTLVLEDYKLFKGYSIDWPKSLENFKLVVEGDAGPLMVSPTGQFIAPASCPATLLIDFIKENMELAERLLSLYESNKSKETEFVNFCLDEFDLESIQKDDNVTPDKMIECCKNLLKNKDPLKDLFKGCRLKISHYYSAQSDGEIYIPWNWIL